MEIAFALTLVSLASIAVSALLLPIVIVKLPEDYFARPRRDPPWQARSLRRKLVSVLRSTIGAVLVAAGIVLLFVPGQGLLTILAGILVAEFPGKFRLERSLVQGRRVRAALDRIRKLAGQPPLRHL